MQGQYTIREMDGTARLCLHNRCWYLPRSSEFYHQLKLITKKIDAILNGKKYFDIKCLKFKLSTEIKILTCLINSTLNIVLSFDMRK